MLKQRTLITVLVLAGTIFSAESLYSQYKSTAMFGGTIGASYTSVSEMSSIFVSEDYYSNYSFTSEAKTTPSASLFFHYRPTKMWVGMETAILYYQLYSSTKYEDINELVYTVDFQYHFVGLGLQVKFYPYKGLFLAPGARVGFCAVPENISYTSNQDEERFEHYHYETSANTESAIKEKVKGQTDIGIGGQLGYEWPLGLSVRIAYYYSVLDIVRTEYNLYNWADPSNNAHSLQFSIGYAFKASKR